MRFSISRCSVDSGCVGRGTWAGVLCLLVLAGGVSDSRAEQWQWRPWVTLAGGYENDRIPDPTLDRFIAPGGGFVDVTPGVTLSRRLGRRTRAALTGEGTVERFMNDENRALYSVVARADVRGVVRGPMQWRVALGGNYFADSERESVDRLGGGGEAAIRFVAARGYVEALGGVEGRRYHNLGAFDDVGELGTYTERTANLGVVAGVRVLDNLALGAQALYQATDARDSFYDASALLYQGTVRWNVNRVGWFSASGLVQNRTFDSRISALDSDSYWQLGAALERAVGANLDMVARYAFARYEQPSSPDEDIHRLSVGVTWWYGRPSFVDILDEPMPAGELPIPRENDVHRFRVHVPAAREVALVGDFNQWNPAANPMRSVGDGWWEVDVSLAAGSYQYAYHVDGVMVTPPDADVTVDDGFGGKNGLFRVEPRSL